jgi:CDP-glucose 4,6-dehydratase
LGGGDLKWSRFVPFAFLFFLENKRPVIRSDGKFVRDYIYVKDVSRSYMTTAEHLSEKKIQGEAFNFSLERPVTVLELVGVIQDLMKARHLEPDVQNNASGEIREQYLTAEKAHRVLGWQPEFTLEKGLGETIEWYKDYLAKHKE